MRATDRTGVEMEALTAAAVAALSLYDTAKAFDRAARIDGLRLLAKSGGKSGDYRRRALSAARRSPLGVLPSGNRHTAFDVNARWPHGGL